MVSPFDVKNKTASRLDRLAVCLLLLVLSVGYFLWLWRHPLASIAAGLGLFALITLTAALFERSTLARRDRALRERLGGVIALEDLLLMPGTEAAATVCRLMCTVLPAEESGPDTMIYEGETWLVRCAQSAAQAKTGEGDILSAHRARRQSGAKHCVLCSTGGFTPAAVRAAEWVDPPVRLIAGPQLGALFGRFHPASDEEIAAYARRQRLPFSFARIRALALAPAKLRRYLLCSFLLLTLYLLSDSLVCLFSCMLSFYLALLCKKENSRSFRL